ncbi:SMR family transporter [Actinokineospora sp. PR83]|uniref:DMT family transporter n=1 Tax=Actinokineospora sp. PR83 TaxID=2884908 RepID=UPI001F299BA8|nr:SMR family transporter [Actinokineospora sp. PR83]MCG8916060.1 SMR family transporter [Actinokineospora sp. PR83]
MAWLFLAGAILAEVGGTLALRVASTGRAIWYGAVGAGYLLAFFLLTRTLAEGVGIGVAYGVWAAAGVALTAVASRVLFEEPLTPLMGAGIALIMGGVLLVELGAVH